MKKNDIEKIQDAVTKLKFKGLGALIVVLVIVFVISLITGKNLLAPPDSGDNNKSTTTAVVTETETENSTTSTKTTEKVTLSAEKSTAKVTTSAKTTTSEKTTAAKVTTTAKPTEAPAAKEYHFRRKSDLTSHFDKHGKEFRGDFNYKTAEDYEKGASAVINNPKALYKTEKEDGDHVYYIEETNEFVVLSKDGYIRTYFRPTRGIDYFHDQ